MQSGIPIGTNPLLETMMFGNGNQEMTDEMQEYREKQKLKISDQKYIISKVNNFFKK